MSKSQGLVRLEGLGKLIKIIHLIGSRTRDLPVLMENIEQNLRIICVMKQYSPSYSHTRKK
jgi:hypothetical protein